ncbi:arginine--tRNA ligase [Agaribacterium haliotis]|uniref:arginine--tRNA ligase n=1 Tax=Agaribacterium haliotis TaxID=2013869 RepID=UPI000BB57F9A|nr:arginine--tRNA ligase [Agaribacterium haliotis]
MNIRSLLQERVRDAMTKAGVPAEFSAHVAPSKNAKFGDYQANGAMAAAKAMQQKPRDLAQSICEQLDLSEIASKVEIAGPGFINIYLQPAWLASAVQQAATHNKLGVEASTDERVVLDYSGPNLAKEMHVGHLRSTIIGDATARILEFVGADVIRQNHVGDWGTQFGMLIAELEDKMDEGEQASLALQDLELFYQAAKKRFDAESEFADRARDYVVKLQAEQEHVLKLWQLFRDVSLSHSEAIYDKLNVSLTAKDIHGESAYNDDLAVLVKELQDKGLAVEDDGAQVCFLDELADKEGNPSPVIVQKKDGGYLYATTDLAALRYRCGKLGAKRIQIFTDDRQSLHIKQVFTLGRKAAFVSDEVKLEHRAFGKMLGKDGKPFKTRSGGTVKLAELLDEAIDKAAEVVKSKNPELSDAEMAQVSQKVGIGAVKYADLSKTRTNDYVFDWESMLSFEGNTGPYLQYAYTRIASIFRKAGVELDSFDAAIELDADKEQALALKLLRFSEVAEQVVEDAYPHVLCNYLYELASLFMSFYEACPILKEGISSELRDSRLMLSKATARTLACGLDLLGIKVMDKM